MAREYGTQYAMVSLFERVPPIVVVQQCHTRTRRPFYGAPRLGSCRATYRQVWTLNIWAWLLLYPSVTRKALQTFDCVELLGASYLRADPAIDCSGGEWWFFAFIAGVGAFTTCVIAPLVLIHQVRHRMPTQSPNVHPCTGCAALG